MTSMKARLTEVQQTWVRHWWRALQPRNGTDAPLPSELWAMGRGQRAEIRRCEDAGALLLQGAVLLFAQRMIALSGEEGWLQDTPMTYERLAWVAGVLATVKVDGEDGNSLAARLGQAANPDRPLMSELRFKALLRATAMPDVFRHWRRAVQLAGYQTDAVRLTEDLLRWQIEAQQPAARASSGVKFQWACDYYLRERDRVATEQADSDKETLQ